MSERVDRCGRAPRGKAPLFDDGVNVFSPLRASRAVALAKMSCPAFSCRFSRRNRAGSSPSVVPKLSLPARGLRAPVLDHAPEHGTSRTRDAAVLPACINSITCQRISGWYGGADLGIVDSSPDAAQVSTNASQRQTALGH